MSFWIATGRIRSSTNARTVSWSRRCSPLSSKSIPPSLLAMRLFPHESLVFGLILALMTAVAFNWSWVAQHTITSKLPRLTIRHPRRSLGLLFSHRRWMFAFVVGIAGWTLYIVAVKLAPLSLVQAVSAGGLALLAVFAQRASGERLPRREWLGVALAVAGLVFLSASLAGGSAHSHGGSGLAAGLMYAAADVGTKAAVGGGDALLFAFPILACHGLAFTLIQLAFQRGR